MDAPVASYSAPSAAPSAPAQAPQARQPVKPVDEAPDTATVQRTRADSASFSQEALRRLAQDQQAKSTPSADGTSGG